MKRACLAISPLVVVASIALLAACVGDEGANNSGSDGGTSADGSSDGSSASDAPTDGPVPPAQGFTMFVAPTHVTGDPGDAPVIQISLLRATGFNDTISFTITTPPGLTASAAAPTPTGGTTSQFTLTFDNGAPPGDVAVTVSGANHDASFAQNATLDVRIGSVIDTSDGGLLVPSYASGIIVSAWGAGGGSAMNVNVGNGGGGGFATATIPVTGGQFLLVPTGTGGTGGGNAGSGGGGGGYSAVCVAAKNCMLVAGGGGGGAFAESGYTCGSGGAGGGTTGASGTQGEAESCDVSTGGGQSSGGVAAACDIEGVNGSAYQGGNGGGTPNVAGGTPGGGSGTESGTGGGGGGYYGGAGGNWDHNTDGMNGGGGGSGYTSTGGTLASGSGINPGGTVDTAHCPANTGMGSTDGGTGGPGCVVVRVTKP